MSQQRICPFCLSDIELGVQECPFCGTNLQNKNPSGCLALGVQLKEKYTIGAYLMVDGEGILYKAVDTESRSFVIIKEYMPVTLCAKRDEQGRLHPKEGSEVMFKTTRIDFFELYRTLQHLGKQPGLLQVKDVFEENESVYSVLEYLEGITLSDYLEKRGQPLSQQEAINLLTPILQGISLLHRQGIIHYGICPQNIRINSKGEAKLSGFATMGLRTAGGELKSQLYDGYSAPEQYYVEQFTGRFTDVYGMAAVIYRVVTGVMPTPANERKLTDSLKLARAVNSQVSVYFSSTLQQCLQINPENRLQTIDELIDIFRNPTKDPDIEQDIETSTEKKAISKGIWIGIACSAVAIILMLILSVVFGRPQKDEVQSDSSSLSSSSQVVTEKIPNFVGEKYADIYQSTEYTSKYLFRIKEEFSSTYEKGIIIAQDPKEGTAVNQKEPLVVLTISKGPEELVVPNLTGFILSEAETELKSMGFTNITIHHVENNGQYAVGCVVDTSPSAGDKVSPKDNIIINVAKVQITPTPEPTLSPTIEPTPTPDVESSSVGESSSNFTEIDISNSSSDVSG